MTQIERQLADNLLSDIGLSILLVTVSCYGFYRLAKLWRVSLVPAAVLLPIFIIVGLIHSFPLSPMYQPSDGEYYYRWGSSLASYFETGAEPEISKVLWPGKGVWPLTIGVLTLIAGPVAAALIVFNASIIVFSVMALQRATLLFGGRSPRWSIVLVFLTSGPFLFWGPSLLREALFWSGVALGVLSLAYASVNRYRNSFIAGGLSTIVLIGIRPDAGIVLAYVFGAMIVFLIGLAGPKRSVGRTVCCLVVILCLGLTFPAAFGVVGEVSPSAVLKSSNALSSDKVSSRFRSSSEPPVFDLCEENPSGDSLAVTLLCGAMKNLPNALLGPFPWEYGPEPIWVLAGASTAHFVILAGLATFYLAVSKGRRLPMIALLTVAAASVLMFSSVLTSYGILVRMRAATEIILIPLAVSGALELVSRRKNSRGNSEASASNQG